MKTVYTLKVRIPVIDTVIHVERTFYFPTMEKRLTARKELEARGFQCSTNIEHLYTPEEAIMAVEREQRWAIDRANARAA